MDTFKEAPLQKRTPPRIGCYEGAAIRLEKYKDNYYPVFMGMQMRNGITAEQAREAAHLLNQLAEFLDWKSDDKSRTIK